MRWGHASSVDLVHWVHHPIALRPSEEGYDENGCWSGGSFISKEGVPTVIYEQSLGAGACIATAEDDLLVRWTKHPANPVFTADDALGADPEHQVSISPCAWLDGDIYYAMAGLHTGNQVPGEEGDQAVLLRSEDLAHWERVGPFYQSERRWTEADEDCAVPDFFPIGDRHMLLFGSHVLGSQYYLGKLQDDRFYPEFHSRLSWPWGPLAGPSSMLDGQGRRIYFDWIREYRPSERQKISGWSGVMTLPRVLGLADDRKLQIEPAPELATLRMNHRAHKEMRVGPDSELALDDVRGDCLELAVNVKPETAREFGVKVRSSPNGEEETVVSLDVSAGTLKVDVTKSSLDEEIRLEPFRGDQPVERLPEEKQRRQAQEAPFKLGPGENLRLRLFVDRSVLEVFANERQCLVQRMYPTRPDSVGVRLFSRGGGATVESLRAWDLAPIH